MTDTAEPENLLILFHQATHLAMRELHRNGSHAQGRILGILAAQGDMGQKALLDQLTIRAASLSELLSKLEKNGNIVRRRDRRDKRNVMVELTPQGRTAAADAKREMQGSIAALFAPLEKTEREALAGLLHKLVTAWTPVMEPFTVAKPSVVTPVESGVTRQKE